MSPTPSPRAVFLDRDGVLNEAVVIEGKPYPPSSPEELRVAADAAESLALLKSLGFLLLVVTNQPDVRRGKTTPQTVEAIHDRLRGLLPLDGIYVCLHDTPDGCDCRKPKPGMLLRAAADHNVRLEGSYMVGDRWADIEAGRAAGCTTVFIDRGYAECRPQSPVHTCATLLDAARWIAGREGRSLEAN